jgi:hypothetical protein
MFTPTSKRQRHAPHLRITLLTILALATVYLIETLTAHQTPVEAASTLAPIFSLPGSYYDQDIQLKMRPPYPNAQVIFTTDGRAPTHTAGTIYTRPVRMSAATPAVIVIRARAVLPDGELGPIASASYFVGVPATLPMTSLIVDPDDLWDPDIGIYANPHEKGDAWERPVDITYVDKDRHSGFHVQAGVRIHGRVSRGSDKKSLRLYFRQEYGTSRLEYPLFSDTGVQSFKRLVLHNGGQDCHIRPQVNWTLIRNSLATELALQLDGYTPHVQPTLLFINGDLWGIYHVRERTDDHFLADHYGIESADFLEEPEHIQEQMILMGDRGNWDHLMQFVETHDLADPANYAYVQSQVDIANFIDYNILQIYAGNTDWPFRNTHQFRPRVQGGRWHWIFWDSDHGFGAYPSYADTNFMNQALDDSNPQTNGRDTLLLRKLLESPVFLEQFISRAADLLNTTLAPPSVVAHIDTLAAELKHDIAYEAIRWSSSTNWKTSVQELRDFANRRPDFVRQHMVERFGLDGTTQLAFNPPPGGSGTVTINGLLVQPDSGGTMPWQGIYFQGIPIHITAVPAPGFRFAGWDPPDLPQTPTITLTVNAALTISPRFETISKDTPQPGDVVFAQYPTDTNSSIQDDWFELLVTRPGGVDLRGWRVTDNDTKTATDEGSLIFTDAPALARVPQGTTILIVMTSHLAQGTEEHVQDDLNIWDRRMVLYVGNGHLNTLVDPGFNLGPHDNLVLLAPGPTHAFDDDQGIAFVAGSPAVTPASFGVLADGVLPIRDPAALQAPADLR